ncbi:MAG: SUMF1/EgtB/PvdO family nonheme iron enzyme [Candidatus Sulfobium sp.]|jgi:formylglycine-generating enzyme required for sulfatase activity
MKVRKEIVSGITGPCAVLIIIFFLPLLFLAAVYARENVTAGRDGAQMVPVPGGDFIMGLPPGEPGSGRNPLRKVHLKAFYIDRCEVTNALYHKCVAGGACKDPSLITDYAKTIHEEGKQWYTDKAMADYPVVGITWRQAGIYCEWAGKRLPLASEWEKAARGTDGRKYPWGNEWDGTRANWDEGGRADGYRKLAPSCSFPRGASPYGAEDMAGNVREWVDNATLKGGSWYSDPVRLRAGDPGHEYMVWKDDDMGFRCAMDAGAAAGGKHGR